VNALEIAPDDLVVMLTVHGSKHAWSRLKWVCDIRRLLDIPGLDVEAAVASVRPWRGVRTVLVGIHLARHFLDAPVPPRVAAMIEQDSGLARLTRQVEQHMLSPTEPSVFRKFRFNWDRRERFSDKLRQAASAFTSPTASDLNHAALPLPLQKMRHLAKLFRP